MVRTFGSIFIFLVFISGCAFHATPYITYDDEKHPLSDTAVLSTMGMKGMAQASLVAVDGKKTSCAQAGCPIWVRVLPGEHSFRFKLVIYKPNVSVGTNYVAYVGEADLVIKEMKPRHVYEAYHNGDGGQLQVLYKDLGENPEFGVTLGLQGVNQKFHRVSFE